MSWFTEDGNRVSLTEISLAPQEFDDYQIGVDATITFCLKELRVMEYLLLQEFALSLHHSAISSSVLCSIYGT